VGKDVIPAKTVGIKTAVVFGRQSEADYSFANFQELLEFAKNNK